MPERIQHIKHRGKHVLQVTLNDAKAEEMLTILDEVQKQVGKYPPQSVLIFADFSGAEINKAVATRMKEALVFDRPFVKRAAWIGAEKIPKVYYENFKSFSRREFPIFKTREEALDWLVAEQGAAAKEK